MTLTRRPIETIDLSEDASPEERQYARNRAAGMSKERARRLAVDPGQAAIGAPRKAQVRVEEGYYPAWERTLNLSRVDYWHCGSMQRSQPGWPDYVVFGYGWLAFVELKAVRIDGRKGGLTTEQKRWRQSVEDAGGEWKTFVLTGNWDEVDAWLFERTSKRVVIKAGAR